MPTAIKEKVKLEEIKTEDFQFKILEEYIKISPNCLKFEAQYQREIEFRRHRNILNSIKKYGYWPQEVITVNENYVVIDGQHRAKAAIECGITSIPISVIQFPNKLQEALFFVIRNNFSTVLSPKNYFHGAYLAKEPYAVLLYNLAWHDDNSLLQYKCKLKDKNTKDVVLIISNMTTIINYIGLNYRNNWTREKVDLYLKKIKERNYFEILNDVNNFAYWFFGCFGKNAKKNPIPYRQKPFRAIINFYCKLIDGQFLNHKDKVKDCISKMKTFYFTNEFIKMDHVGQMMTLIAHFNRQKTHKLIYY